MTCRSNSLCFFCSSPLHIEEFCSKRYMNCDYVHTTKVCKKKTSMRCSICRMKGHLSKKCTHRCMTCSDLHHHTRCKLKRSIIGPLYRHPCSVCGSTNHPFIECKIYKNKQEEKKEKKQKKQKKQERETFKQLQTINPIDYQNIYNNDNSILSKQLEEFENSMNYIVSDAFWNKLYKTTNLPTIYEADDENDIDESDIIDNPNLFAI